MSQRVVATALGMVLLFTSASPLAAQSNNGPQVGNKAARQGVMTPDIRRHSTHAGFLQGLDNHRLLTDQSASLQLHENANEIAECIVRRGGEKAPTYLGGGLAGDPGYQRIGDALTGRLRTCANTEAEATAIAINGSLAEQLLVARAPQVQDRAPMVNEDTARRFFGDLTGAVTFDSIAGCIAVYSPGLTYKVIQAPAGSSQELAALDAAYKQTPECGITATPSTIPVLYQRGALAAALYQWTSQNS